jgi:hypothetical protein
VLDDLGFQARLHRSQVDVAFIGIVDGRVLRIDEPADRRMLPSCWPTLALAPAHRASAVSLVLVLRPVLSHGVSGGLSRLGRITEIIGYTLITLIGPVLLADSLRSVPPGNILPASRPRWWPSADIMQIVAQGFLDR